MRPCFIDGPEQGFPAHSSRQLPHISQALAPIYMQVPSKDPIDHDHFTFLHFQLFFHALLLRGRHFHRSIADRWQWAINPSLAVSRTAATYVFRLLCLHIDRRNRHKLHAGTLLTVLY